MSGFSISIRKSSGKPVPVGNLELTPISQALVIHAPGQVHGLVWNRPVAVRVKRVEAPGAEMPATQVPVYDYTRRAQMLILGVGLLGSALIWLIFRNRSKHSIRKLGNYTFLYTKNLRFFVYKKVDPFEFWDNKLRRYSMTDEVDFDLNKDKIKKWTRSRRQ